MAGFDGLGFSRFLVGGDSEAGNEARRSEPKLIQTESNPLRMRENDEKKIITAIDEGGGGRGGEGDARCWKLSNIWRLQ